jgi:hypothetical protein
MFIAAVDRRLALRQECHIRTVVVTCANRNVPSKYPRQLWRAGMKKHRTP